MADVQSFVKICSRFKMKGGTNTAGWLRTPQFIPSERKMGCRGGGLRRGNKVHNQHNKLGNVHRVNRTGACALSCNYFTTRNMYRQTSRGHKMWGSVLRAVAKLRKVAISFVTSNVTPCGRTFMKTDILVFFENLLSKFKFNQNLKSITATSQQNTALAPCTTGWLRLQTHTLNHRVAKATDTHSAPQGG
jgi:hypothetical protein